MNAVSPEVAPARTADRIVSWLASMGVRTIFGVPGGAISPVYDALEDSDIGLVMCQSEMMAAYLACGHARATGVPGVVAVTSGPGVLNTASAAAAAMLDEVPLLVLAGDVRTDWAGRGAIQDGSPHGLDIVSVFASLARYRATVDAPERAEELLSEAWARITAHPRGSALLRLPVDVTGAPSIGAVPAWSAVTRPAAPEPDTIERVARMVAEAQRPLVLVGLGVKSASASDGVLRLVHRAKLPLVTDVEGKGAIPETDPRCLGLLGVGASPDAVRYANEDVDLLITIGARLDDMATREFTLCPRAKLVQIDHDPVRMHRLRTADVPVLADLRLTLDMLVDALPALPVKTVLQREALLRAARSASPQLVPAAVEAVGGPLDPAAVVRALQQAVGPDAVFVSDIGNHLVFAARNVVAEHPGSFVASVGLGSMGSGIGTAIGMAMGFRGARPVVAVCGDGGLLMVGTELATCARYEIPLIVCVFDNGQLAMVEQGQRAIFGRSGCAGVPQVDLVAFAQALGVEAATVPSLDQLPAAIAGAPRGPLLLRFPVDPAAVSFNPRLAGFQRAAK